MYIFLSISTSVTWERRGLKYSQSLGTLISLGVRGGGERNENKKEEEEEEDEWQ